MTFSGRLPLRILLFAVAVCLVWALPAQANVTLPGLNEKIGFSSFRDHAQEQQEDGCEGSEIFDDRCGEELYYMEPDGSFQNRLLPLNLRKDAKFSWSPLVGGLISFESRQNCEQYGEEEIDNRGCQADVYSVDGANVGGTQTQLTSHPGSDTHPSWNPAADRIAFESDRSDESSGSFPFGGPPTQLVHARAIYTMPSTGELGGSPATPLLPTPDDDDDPDTFELISDLTPAWSPDGAQIAFTRFKFVLAEFDKSAELLDAARELAAAYADGKLTDDVLRERLGAVPLGAFVAVSVQTYVAPAAGGGPLSLVAEEEDVCAVVGDILAGPSEDDPRVCQIDRHPAWSPDGTKLYIDRMAIDYRGFDVERAGPGGILLLLFTGQDRDIWSIVAADPTQQSNLSDATEDPDCVPVGTELFLPPGGKGNGTDNPCHEEAKPAPSPDGTKVAFHSDRACPADSEERNASEQRLENRPSRCFDIHSMNVDGSGVTRLTDSLEADWNADWRRTEPPPAVTATPPPAAAAPRTPARPSARIAGVRTRGCTASARMRVRIRVSAEAGVRQVRVSLDGRRIKTTTKSRFTVFVNARRLKSGRHRLSVTVTDRAGQRRTTTRRFSRCARRQRRAAPRFTG